MELSSFRVALEGELAQPVNDYFDYLSKLSLSNGPLSKLVNNLKLIRARSKLHNALKALIGDGHMVAAEIGNSNQPLSAKQLKIVRQRIADSERYLLAYMKALPKSDILAAVARIVLYSAAIVQTASAISSEGKGKPKLPVYPGDRSLACNGFCHCGLDWIAVSGGFDVFWRMDETAEHCEDCKDLSARWNPLRIRNGQIQDKAIKAVYAEYLLRRAGSL